METINLSKSLEAVNKMSFEEHQIWLDNVLSLKKQSSFFYFMHLSEFLRKYSSSLGLTKMVYLEKQFYMSLDLKLLDWSEKILNNFKEIFGDETKIRRMFADLQQIKQTKDTDADGLTPLEESLNIYKNLIKKNQNDHKSIKSYLALIKTTVDLDNVRTLIDMYNEYLKVYMDDIEIWNELADIYISTLNYNKAIFCLEEILLHYPNDYITCIKIGDILSSFSNTDSSSNALKYYSRSIMINPTPRAFWGIVNVINTFLKYKKPLSETMKKSFIIATENLKTMYDSKDIDDLLPKIDN